MPENEAEPKFENDESPSSDVSDFVDARIVESGLVAFAQRQSLSPMHVVVEQRLGYLSSAIVAIVVLSVTIPIAIWGVDVWWGRAIFLVGWALLLGTLIWFSHCWPPLSYRYTHWRLADVGFEIERGVFFQHRIAIPVARVQHVDVTQGPIQRMVDLSKITIHTAGTTNASIELNGLQHRIAMQLRDALIAKKEGGDAL